MRLRQAKKIMKNFPGMLWIYGTGRLDKANNIVLHHYSRVKPGIKVRNALTDKDPLLAIKMLNELIKEIKGRHRLNDIFMGINQIVRDERELKKLLRSSTGLKVFEAMLIGSYNGFRSLSDEAILDKAHITFYRGNWDCNNGGIYKICIYTPSIENRANVPYIQSIVRKITNALDIRFGKDGWNECNQSLLERWRPLSRFSFYLQLPNFRDIITGTSSAKQV